MLARVDMVLMGPVEPLKVPLTLGVEGGGLDAKPGESVMDIIFEGEYKAIADFEWKDIPPFAVITGPNGVGKSQLLQLIDLYLNPSREAERHRFSGNLTITDSGKFYGKTPIMSSEWRIQSAEKYGFAELQKEYEAIVNILHDPKKLSRLISNDPAWYSLFEDIAHHSGKAIVKLTQDNLDEYYKTFPLLRSDLLFHNNLTRIFVNYYADFLEHRRSGKSEEEIVKENPKPWVVVQEIFERARQPFRLTNPEQESFKKPFKLRLYNTENDKQIHFPDLSSGEKVLLGIAMWLYSADATRTFPRMLLLDEPDAHLHPSMTKQLIDTLHGTLVKDHDIRVIMTTHSPSTVALAPEESLYVMKKNGTRLERISKDKALGILTAGVPSISIHYENRRQVFVESKYDVSFYDKVRDKLKDKLIPEISISFISAGTGGSGSAEQVKSVVNQLATNGTKSVYGIIDWDGENEASNFVKVLGYESRDNRESYIFDPVFVAAYLLRERMVDRSDLGVEEGETDGDFRNFSNQRLQRAADHVLQAVKDQLGVDPQLDEEAETVRYVSGREIKIPTWYLRMDGHKLVEHIRQAFQPLLRFEEKDLVKEIVGKIIDDLPGLLSADFLTVLREIQENQVSA